MSARATPSAGISDARADFISKAALGILGGLEALEALAEFEENSTVSAATVRWFVDKLRADANLCLIMADGLEPEPEARS